MMDRRTYDLEFKKSLLTADFVSERNNGQYTLNYQQNQNGDSNGTFRVNDNMRSQRNSSSQAPYHSAHHSFEQAGGDARVSTLKKKPSPGNDEQQFERSYQHAHHHHKHQQESDPSSSLTDSSKATRIEKNPTKHDLLRLTQSKINLAQTIDEGIGKNSRSKRSCTKVAPSCQDHHKIAHSASDKFNCCSSPPAELINEKVIQPMVKQFRLLYLQNIKKEVAIMEEFEELPDKMDKICRDRKIHE